MYGLECAGLYMRVCTYAKCSSIFVMSFSVTFSRTRGRACSKTCWNALPCPASTSAPKARRGSCGAWAASSSWRPRFAITSVMIEKSLHSQRTISSAARRRTRAAYGPGRSIMISWGTEIATKGNLKHKTTTNEIRLFCCAPARHDALHIGDRRVFLAPAWEFEIT